MAEDLPEPFIRKELSEEQVERFRKIEVELDVINKKLRKQGVRFI